MKSTLTALALVALASAAHAALVSGWQLTFDGDGDASFTAGTDLTASPQVSDAHRTSPAANFPTITLTDGDSIILTGTVSFSGALANGQFRFGLFDGDNPVAAGDGVGYAGLYAEAPDFDGPAVISSTDGTSTPHPFATTGSSDLISMSDPGVTPTANTPLGFSLTIARNGALVDVMASITDGGSYTSSASVLGTAAVPGSFTYDSAAFLMGGSFVEPMTASFSNIDVSYIPEPSTSLLGVLGALALLRRNRA